MEFKVGETFSVSVTVDEDDICFESNSVFIEVCDSDATPAGRSYVDITTTVPASSIMVDDISLDPLGTLHASPLCSLPPFPLSVIICRLLHVMICLRGVCLTVWTP